MRWAAKPKLSIPVILVLSLAAVTIVTNRSEAASTCPVNVDAYTASAQVLTSCKLATFPVSSRIRLPDQGVMTYYGGSHLAVLTPPAGFDPATASPSELAQYGIPAEPSTAGPQQNLWIKMARNFHPAPAPISMHSAAAGTTFDSPTKTNLTKNDHAVSPTTNWSGYYDFLKKPALTFASTTYLEPYSGNVSGCAPSATVAYWTGLGGGGGSSTGAWGQAGTQDGRWGDGLQADQAWIEVFDNNGDTQIDPVPFFATPFSSFTVNVELLQQNEWIFSFYNSASEDSFTVAAFYSTPASFSTALWIIERQSGDDLGDFARTAFVGDRAGPSGSKLHPATHYPYGEADLWSGGPPYTSPPNHLLATDGTLQYSRFVGANFFDTWDQCN